MDSHLLLLAFSSGMLATVNPCGFAMLPAYLSYFLGLGDNSADPRSGVLRSLAVGLSVSVGFLLVFFLLGVPFASVANSPAFRSRLPLVTMGTGVGLALLGLAMVRGFEPALKLPKLERGTGSREVPTMFLFGVSYAVSSLSCTIPLFLGLVASSFAQENWSEGMVTFLAYGSGMAVVLMALTLSMALARQGLLLLLRRSLRIIHRLSGVLLVLAGSYLAYYGWYENRTLNGTELPGQPSDVISGWNNDVRAWITTTGSARIGLLLVAAIALAVLVASGWRKSPAPPPPPPAE